MDRVLLRSWAPPGRYDLFVLVAVLAALTGACSSNQPEILPTTIGADRLLFERGTAALEEEDWFRAAEYFTQVRDNYPQSEYREEARLGLGDAQIGGGSAVTYVSATAEFREFLSVYPTDPRADYAQFKLGLINFLQMRPPDRDQSFTKNAVADFEAFILRYPDSALMPEVQAHLRGARDRLGASEVIVGRYYYRNKWWPGAISRLEPIIEEDPGYGDRDEVYFYLGASHRGAGSSSKALQLFERLLEEFPESEFVEQVNRALPELRAEAAAETEADGDNEDAATQPDAAAESDTASAPAR